jgi:hypothetical protein
MQTNPQSAQPSEPIAREVVGLIDARPAFVRALILATILLAVDVLVLQ